MMPAVSQNISGKWITRIKISFNPLIFKHKKILSNSSEKSSSQFTNIHIAALNAAAKAMTGDTDSTRGDFFVRFFFSCRRLLHADTVMIFVSWCGYINRVLAWIKKEASKKAFREKRDTLESKCVHVLEISVNNDVKNWR